MNFKIVLFFHLAVCFAFPQSEKTDSNAVFFLSDCQQPLFVEKLSLRAYRNEEGRDSLFFDIIRQRPRCLFLLGDLTAAGSKRKKWQPINAFLFTLRKDNCSVYAIPGNHEYMVNAKKGIKNFIKSFGRQQTLGYCVKRGSLAIVMLNSNFNHIPSADFNWQQNWYLAEMDSLDKDSTIKSILIGTHHPPYTNSSAVGPSKRVEQDFVPRFEKSPKARLFLSGHSHNLEYFNSSSGKQYMVIGGGGGLAQPLLPEDKRWYIDQLPQIKKPLFFYIIITVGGESLSIEIRGLDKNFNAMRYSLP
jgi:predicted MPP superfamily phosphohydrolase